ncbi:MULTISPECIES: hypothetical protein [Bacillus]|nr:hypothetical protein [Bacillus wiedmannii]
MKAMDEGEKKTVILK